MDVERAADLIVYPEEVRTCAGTRVLVVDNNEASVAVLTKMLTAREYKVTVVERASDALTFIREREDELDLILTEFYLPDMDGLEFLENVEELTDLPVIVMSADESMELIMSCLYKGARVVYEKPLPKCIVDILWQFTVKRLVHYPVETQPVEMYNKGLGSPSESEGDDQSRKRPKQVEQLEVEGKEVEQSDETENP